MEFEMEFEQKVIHFLLAEGEYRDSRLRPDDIKKISALRACKLINVEINSQPINAFQPHKNDAQSLLPERKAQYAFICFLSELDDEKALELTLSPKEIIKLRSLSYIDIVHLTNTLGNNIVKVSVNTRMLEMAIHQRQKSHKRQTLIEELVKAGASKLYMKEVYLLPPKKYKFLRNAYQLEKAFGRPRLLSDEEALAVYNLWLKHSPLPEGEAYLEIYKEINSISEKQINIRNIVKAVQEFSGESSNAL
jgi:hypothetical protein